MTTKLQTATLLDEGTLSFTIESRIVRELGERLVKQPEVALVELIKNSYDADAQTCDVAYNPPVSIVVTDDGHGMTLKVFKNSWMRIGTSAKEDQPLSKRFKRVITGEKGIGRFAVRFLGRALDLETVADDPDRGFRTLLTATFDWLTFDKHEDLGDVTVPYRLVRADPTRATGTSLKITKLRQAAAQIKVKSVRTASIAVVSPFRALMREHAGVVNKGKKDSDPGFALKISPSDDELETDVAQSVLGNAVLRSVVELEDNRLKLRVFRKDSDEPSLSINDRFENRIGILYADIRFFPRRKGTFADIGVAGVKAQEWIRENSGVAVFDRQFRVLPYGLAGDDWLRLASDTAKRERDPRSSLAKKHFPMDEATRTSTQLNFMLRLPYPEQLIGVVQVEGRRSKQQTSDDQGLVAAADREGFVDNEAFRQLVDVVRGAVEAIASADRELQQEQEKAEQHQLIRSLRAESRAAIREVESNPSISRGDKSRIVRKLAETYALAQEHEERTKQRESALEVMSLLGVVAGFMTHEFGTAMHELEKAERRLRDLGKREESLKTAADAIAANITRLRDFVTYSQGYVQGASSGPARPYAVRPRLQQVVRVFGQYASDRDIDVGLEVEPDLIAPLVPVSLYSGIALNLFTNALKAVTAKVGTGDRRISFKAWNEEKWHFLEVVDTGIGIPAAMRERVFDPLFTTTSSNRDPLGSGMGLGLALVKRGAEAFGGRALVVDPPAGYSTSVRVQLRLDGGNE